MGVVLMVFARRFIALSIYRRTASGLFAAVRRMRANEFQHEQKKRLLSWEAGASLRVKRHFDTFL